MFGIFHRNNNTVHTPTYVQKYGKIYVCFLFFYPELGPLSDMVIMHVPEKTEDRCRGTGQRAASQQTVVFFRGGRVF